MDLHELTVFFKRELKAKMKFTKLAPMKEAVYTFGFVLVDGKIHVQGGGASYIDETAKKSSTMYQAIQNPLLPIL